MDEKKTVGTPCGGLPQQDLGLCAAGLLCVPTDDGSPGSCEPISELRAPCGHWCAEMTTCIEGTCQLAPLHAACPW
jgi:hypothetical protein